MEPKMITVEVISLDERDFINNYKQFAYHQGNKLNTLDAIKEYVDNEFPKSDCNKITIKKWNKDSNIIEDIPLLHTENIGTRNGHLIIEDQRSSRKAFSKSLEDRVSEIIFDRPMIIPECREEKIINPKEQKVNELINMYDQLTDADYAKILSTARILVMRKS